ncbi:MAG: CRISPR-associated helicase Cas3' [Cyanobacteria bacterium]|nr:CRISPR-associated helicase Cas3' [Cyanobacteriota bacterium]
MIFYSHPNILLKDHLKLVSDKSASFFNNIKNLINNNNLIEISRLIGLGHDFGKYTTFFQEHLLHMQNKPGDKKSHHGLISALFTTSIIKHYFNVDIKNSGKEKYNLLLPYLIVLHHHGDLNNAEDDIPFIPNDFDLESDDIYNLSEDWPSKIKLIINDQVPDLYKNIYLIQKEYQELGIDNIEFFFKNKDYIEIFKELNYLNYLFYKENETIKKEISFKLLVLYSTLIDSDKRIAAEIDIEIERKKIDSNIIKKYINSHFVSNNNSNKSLDILRNKIFNEVNENINKFDTENHFYTITAPTGSGKTLSSFSVALRLREKIFNEKNFLPKIIYSLPFITIIDQNYDVIYNILKENINDFYVNESKYLIKHHHLNDLNYKIGNEFLPIDSSLMLIDSWESEIIITTFIQLLYTIIGFKNSFLKKYHNIYGSIILLDEVQNIPIEYWGLIRKMLIFLAEYMNCYIILLTATKPLIFDKNDNVIELVNNVEQKFKSLNRVNINKQLEKIDEDIFIEKFIKNYNINNSYLIVLNTIGSSIYIFNKIKEKIKENVFYLSTNIIPLQRLDRIKKIRELLAENKKPILITTQIIEAGIDLDFDIAYRDLGPLDSIIQVCGRCNREGKKEISNVNIFQIKDYCSKIYGAIHTIVSRDIFNEKEVINESDFFDLINNYFELVKNKKNLDDSNKIWNSFINLYFHSNDNNSLSDFKLIQDFSLYNIFVEFNEEAKELWDIYINEIIEEKDFFKKRIKYLKIKSKLNKYLLSINTFNKNIPLPPELENSSFRYIPYNQLKDWYNFDTGFKREIDVFVW